MSKKTIVINSKDRSQGSSSNFVIKINRRQHYICKTFCIKSVVIDWTFYNINSNNNLLTFTHPNVGSGSTTITIPPGNYSASELNSAINSEISNIDADFSISYSSITGKYTFSSSAESFGLDATGSTSILSLIMGFKSEVYDSDSTSKTSTNVANLGGPNYIYIKSNALAYPEKYEPQSTKTNDDHIIGIIPVNVNIGESLVYQPEINHIDFCREFPNVIDLRLTTYNNANIDLNGGEWSMVIEAIFEAVRFI